MSQHNQFSLMKTYRFLPLFITQFFGAFNDNVFKNALLILIAFNVSILPSGMDDSTAVNLSAGFFILPFFIFSSLAGQLADYNEKSKLIRILKVFELCLVFLCGASLYFQNIYLMWISLFLMGTQSAFFGPIKYSILPQHLKERELVGGNSLIEMGTFISILIGTMVGVSLISVENGIYYIFVVLLCASLIGLYSSFNIPNAKAATYGKIDFNIFKQSWEIIKISKEIKSVFLSILGISWFWFLGATFLSQFPFFVKDIFNSDENVVTILLVVFSVGIALGSLACEKLSRGKIEPGLVPFGAIGMTIFGILLYQALTSFPTLAQEITVMQFLETSQSWSVLGSLFGIAIFGGFFTVPLYAMIQSRSKPENRSRTIAANNILNAFFMIGSAIFAVVCNMFELKVAQLILAATILNALVSIYIFSIVPEFFMRFIVWALMSTLYRLKVKGSDNIPDEGSAIVVSNHVSFVDAILIFGSIHRPVKFVMYYKIYNIPILKTLFKSLGTIPIASKHENEEVFNKAFEKINQYLQEGEIVMIFPEGKIAEVEEIGKINEFKPGIIKTLEKNPVMVIPSALSGLYGSMFSRKEKTIWRYIPKSFFNREVYYSIGDPIEPSKVELKDLENKVIELRDNK